jgi:serine protease Do
MPSANPGIVVRFAQILALAVAVHAGVPGIAQEPGRATDSTLVRVNIVSEVQPGRDFELHGQRLPDYQPKIIQVFPSTGVVIDDKGHVLTFLGYRWVDIQPSDVRIDIISSSGKFRGRLVGIDQSMGVAVVVAKDGKLKPTPICKKCEIREGTTVVTPVPREAGLPQFQTTRVISVAGAAQAGRGQWTMTIGRLHGVGEPILNMNHEVLGYVSSQQSSQNEPDGVQITFFPMAQLLGSAAKILSAGGDIQTGWLGVYVEPESSGPGVEIRSILEGSPADKAQLAPGDVIRSWQGTEVRSPMQFVRLVQDTSIGSRVDIGIVRNGRPLTLTALIESRKPGEAGERLNFRIPELAPETGIKAIPLTPPLAEALRLPRQSGLLVLHVDPEISPFGAELQAGDIIISIDGDSVHDIRDLLRPDTFTLKLLRNHTEQQIRVRPR